MYKIISTNDETLSNSNNVNSLPWTYLHGKAEEVWGYDMCCALGDSYPTDKKGIYNCVLLDEDMNKLPCVAFVWFNGRSYTGLIVLSDDAESYAYAYDNYKKDSKGI